MATLSIIQWREDYVGFTGWDAHAKSETRRRLKQAIDGSPGLVRYYARQIRDRQLVTIEHVKDDAVAGIRQILETQGAEILVVQGRLP